jgi:hypothetical protein
MGVIGPLLVGLPIAMEALAQLNRGASPIEDLAGAGGSIGGGVLGAGLGGAVGLTSKHRKWLSPLLAAGGGFGVAAVGGSSGRSAAGFFRGDPEFDKLRRVAELERMTAQQRLRDQLELDNWRASQQASRDIDAIFAQNAFAPRPPTPRTPSQIASLAAALGQAALS